MFRRLSVLDNLLAVLELRRELGASAREERAVRLISEFELGQVRGRVLPARV